MRDIRADLLDRVHSVAHEISAENVRFKSLVSELKTAEPAPHGPLQDIR